MNFSCMPKFKEGDILCCIRARDSRDSRELKANQHYVALTDLEAGIFEGRPFITVELEGGRKWSGHASRFIPTQATFKTSDGYVLTWDVESRTWSDGDLIFQTTLDRGIWPLEAETFHKLEGDFV